MRAAGFRIVPVLLPLLLSCYGFAATLRVGPAQPLVTITEGLAQAAPGDTIIVEAGTYKEGNIIIDKPVFLLGENYPVVDGEKKFEVITIRASYVTIKGLRVEHSKANSMNDPCAIRVLACHHVTIEDNELHDNFFGIYIQEGTHCLVKHNTITGLGERERETGNAIHCWKSDSLQVIGNTISGHRDGIYFEFVTNSVIWRNRSANNIRYGLHFMFSHHDAYFTNYFKNNGAGVAVMFSHNVVMMNNTFAGNWGDAAYGLLLKEISDCYLGGNQFVQNTSAIFMDGTNRILAEKNVFQANGWGMKIQANCLGNTITHNNFVGNTFDVSTNGSLTLNAFSNNYWDKYEGYDLDKNGIGDLPYHPLSLYAVIVETNPPAMLLYRSFMVTLLDQSEKKLPSLTPQNFVDPTPLMHALPL